ncbi:hypothetical protein EJ08DRAFT_692632 [Tothia fuscella]|uniref:Secreted protein n=1 Tax=Tothia fuscella TaxID=1048955 RepID=A0A9P4U391_9PEZI|nr:hypothetical protein EJ08DRAFT_692632 [Tothia fuscella]
MTTLVLVVFGISPNPVTCCPVGQTLELLEFATRTFLVRLSLVPVTATFYDPNDSHEFFDLMQSKTGTCFAWLRHTIIYSPALHVNGSLLSFLTWHQIPFVTSALCSLVPARMQSTRYGMHMSYREGSRKGPAHAPTRFIHGQKSSSTHDEHG